MQKKVFCNWKMYLAPEDAQTLAAELVDRFGDETGIAVFPSFEVVSPIASVIQGTELLLGAQDCFWEDTGARGAYTGEVSPSNLKQIGCHYVLVGHSERRRMGETDAQIAKKMGAAMRAGLTPLLCVGESESEREAARAHEVVKEQIARGTEGLTETDYMIVYEPVWAIGTGKPATPDAAAEMCAFIKRTVGEWVVTLYGGSVDGNNVAQYTAHESIDGFLVGGASTKGETLFPLLSAIG